MKPLDGTMHAHLDPDQDPPRTLTVEVQGEVPPEHVIGFLQRFFEWNDNIRLTRVQVDLTGPTKEAP